MYSNTADCSSRRDGQAAAVDQLLFEGGEERLGDGVVIRVSAGAHRDRDPRVACGPAEREAHALAALVGVVDQAGRRAPASDRHLQRVDHERRAHVRGHRPADAEWIAARLERACRELGTTVVRSAEQRFTIEPTHH